MPCAADVLGACVGSGVARLHSCCHAHEPIVNTAVGRCYQVVSHARALLAVVKCGKTCLLQHAPACLLACVSCCVPCTEWPRLPGMGFTALPTRVKTAHSKPLIHSWPPGSKQNSKSAVPQATDKCIRRKGSAHTATAWHCG